MFVIKGWDQDKQNNGVPCCHYPRKVSQTIHEPGGPQIRSLLPPPAFNPSSRVSSAKSDQRKLVILHRGLQKSWTLWPAKILMQSGHDFCNPLWLMGNPCSLGQHPIFFSVQIEVSCLEDFCPHMVAFSIKA